MTAPRHPNQPPPYERQAPPPPYPEPPYPEPPYPDKPNRPGSHRQPAPGQLPHPRLPYPELPHPRPPHLEQQHPRHARHEQPYPPQSHPEQPYPRHARREPQHPGTHRAQPNRRPVAHPEEQYPRHAYREPHSEQLNRRPAHPAQQPYHRHVVEEQPLRREPARYHEEPAPPAAAPAGPRRQRFGALAWSAFILGIVGVVGSPMFILNNFTAVVFTAVVAGVGTVLGVVALFGTRKVLAGIGVVLCVAAIVFTVMAQRAAVAELDRALGGLTGDDPAASADVTVRDCAVVDRGYGLVMAEGTIEITNSTGEPQSHMVTVSVNDESGGRVGEINAFADSFAPGQSVVLSGTDATGTATEQARPGPAACQVADVTRFGG
jgi:hypothetical protein